MLATEYEMKLVSGVLTAIHQRNRDFPLNLNPEDDVFIGDHGFFRYVRFARNASGEVTGFYLDQVTSKALWFRKY